MKTIDYFKQLAKKLLKDFKTQTLQVDPVDELTYFSYSPSYLDVDQIILDYDLNEDNFSLMKAQHVIAQMVGFKNWSTLINASTPELELAKLIWDYQHKIHLEDWENYIHRVESENGTLLDHEVKLAIFKTVFVDVDEHFSYMIDYRSNES